MTVIDTSHNKSLRANECPHPPPVESCIFVASFDNYKPIGPTARKSVQRCLLYHL
jgi:hypothetical protein